MLDLAITLGEAHRASLMSWSPGLVSGKVQPIVSSFRFCDQESGTAMQMISSYFHLPLLGLSQHLNRSKTSVIRTGFGEVIMASTSPLTLLDLPLELRFQIYSYLLRSHSGQIASTKTLRHMPMPTLQVLQTCKQIHVEAQQYLFEHNVCNWEISPYTRLTEIEQLEATVAKFRHTKLWLRTDCNCALAWLVLSKITAALLSAQETNILPPAISISICFSVRLNRLQRSAITSSHRGFLDRRQEFKDATVGVQVAPVMHGPQGRRRRMKAVLQLPAWEAQLQAMFVKTQLQQCLKPLQALAGLSKSISLTSNLKDGGCNTEIEWINRTVVGFRDEKHKRRGRVIVTPGVRGCPLWDGETGDVVDDLDVRLLRWREGQ